MIRIPEKVWASIQAHLFSKAGEHFAFMLARWTYSGGQPVFMVRDVILVPDEQVKISRYGWELTTEGIVNVINAGVRSRDALIEVHNHGGIKPRFSSLDREGLRDFPAYVLDSLQGRPYGATVWGDSNVYGEFFTPAGETGILRGISVVGDRLRQIVSRSDDTEPIETTFDRQLPWFTPEGQRMLGRFKVAVGGAGGTGSPLIQNLVYLGVRDFALVEYDNADDTNMNRLVTATAADIGTPKGMLARRLIKSVAPGAKVALIDRKVQSAEALDALKGADIIFGCFDNDGARLVMNELALAYGIPYFDLGSGIEAEQGKVESAGGRVAVVVPSGPCLMCMRQINTEEARFFLSTPEEQAFQIERGYIRGMNVKAPSVVSLNAAVAAAAANEFAVFVSGLRPVNAYTEIDLLGVGRPLKSQWTTPNRVEANPGCVQCMIAGAGDDAGIDRYAAEKVAVC
jgi:molybdopterin/thiamine biosynthesis adenylyltransferase